ncbi:MAG: hypothetical protein DRP87_08715 [Spirochaetes bacterium]|nr:MAG: hypothetical protein DRP87_08715 [Spirochaetota bacterium]
MKVNNYLDTLPLFEIELYDVHKGLKKDCVAFTGTPRKHPYDNEKMILILDPFSSDTIFFEFKIEDIADVEYMPSIATESGKSLKMVKIWVKKGSLGIKYEPFEVGQPLKFLKDSEILQQNIGDENYNF